MGVQRAKRARDPNQLAKAIVEIAAGEGEENLSPQTAAYRAGKGRAGGLVGGRARAQSLSEQERSDIARAAAAARWKRR